MWRVLSTHSIRQFPLHFPSRASPCVITFQLEYICRCCVWPNLATKADHRVCCVVSNTSPFISESWCWTRWGISSTTQRSFESGMACPASRLDLCALDKGWTIPKGGETIFVLRKVTSYHPFGCCSFEVDSLFGYLKNCTPLIYRRLVDRIKMDLFIRHAIKTVGPGNAARDFNNSLKP